MRNAYDTGWAVIDAVVIEKCNVAGTEQLCNPGGADIRFVIAGNEESRGAEVLQRLKGFTSGFVEIVEQVAGDKYQVGIEGVCFVNYSVEKACAYGAYMDIGQVNDTQVKAGGNGKGFDAKQLSINHRVYRYDGNNGYYDKAGGGRIYSYEQSQQLVNEQGGK